MTSSYNTYNMCVPINNTTTTTTLKTRQNDDLQSHVGEEQDDEMGTKKKPESLNLGQRTARCLQVCGGGGGARGPDVRFPSRSLRRRGRRPANSHTHTAADPSA